MRIITKVMDWNHRTVLRLYHAGGLTISPTDEEGFPFNVDHFIQLTPLTATMLAKELKKWARAERRHGLNLRIFGGGSRKYFNMKGWSKK